MGAEGAGGRGSPGFRAKALGEVLMQHPHDLLGRHRSPSPHSARAQRERGPDPSSRAKSGFKGSEMFSVGKLSASIPPPCSYTSVDTQIHP